LFADIFDSHGPFNNFRSYQELYKNKPCGDSNNKEIKEHASDLEIIPNPNKDPVEDRKHKTY
jgi:hypothetical protein